MEQRGTGTCLSSVHKGGITILWNRGEREPVSHLYTRGGGGGGATILWNRGEREPVSHLYTRGGGGGNHPVEQRGMGACLSSVP